MLQLLKIGQNKTSLDYTYNLKEKQTGITNLLQNLKEKNHRYIKLI